MADRRRAWRDPLVLLTSLVMMAAVVTVGAVIGAEYGSRGAPDPARDADGVPLTQPDGNPLPPVPAVVRTALNGPVVAAPVPEELPPMSGCRDRVDWTGEPVVRAASVTPEGLTAVLRGEGPEDGDRLANLTCHARWDGERWRVWATWSGAATDEQTVTGMLEPVCCLGEGVALAGMETVAPDGAVWSAQRRDGYWLVYTVGDGQVVHLMWPTRAGTDGTVPEVVHLDRDGEAIAPHADTEG